MPLNSEAQFLSNDYLAKGLLEDSPSRLQFLNLLPFYAIRGNSLTYARTPQIALAKDIGFCDPITEDTKLPMDPNASFPMAELAAHVEVSYKAADIFCETNDLLAVERGLAVRQLLYKYARLFQDGDSGVNPDEYDGLNKIIDPTKIIDLACTPLTIETLDKAKGMVRTNQGYCGVIITNQTGYEFLRKAYYNIGDRPAEVAMRVSNPLGGTKEQKVTAFDGWVVLINDQQPDFTCGAPAVPAANFWFAIFGWDHLHGIIPDCGQESMFQVRTTMRPDDSKEVGHVTFPVGLALGSRCALSAIKNATEPATGGGGGPCCDATLITVNDESAVAANSRQLAGAFAVSTEDGGPGQKLKLGSFQPFRKLAFVENFFFFDDDDMTLENQYIKTASIFDVDAVFVPDPGGIIKFLTTTPDNNERYYLRSNDSGTGNQGPIDVTRNPRLLVLMRTTSGGTGTKPVMHVGVMNETPPTGASPDPDSGVFFRKKSSDTNYIAVCRNNGVESTLDTGVAAADSVFRRLEMIVTGTTSVEVLVDGVSKGTITTNIPTETLGIIFGINTADEVQSTPTIEIDAIAVEEDAF